MEQSLMAPINEIVFVNHFHNGDLHISREFIRKIKAKFPQYSYGYANKHNSYVLKDLGLNHYDSRTINFGSEFNGHIQIGNKLYLNTWYGSCKGKFNCACGIAFDALYCLFDHYLKTFFNSSIRELDPDPTKFFPTIDFSHYAIDNAKKYMDVAGSKWAKRIFFSNGAVLSGQAPNVSLAPMINQMAEKYQTDLFIYTNEDNSITPRHNVVCTKSIINKQLPCDLNENSYIAERSDIIIGKSSGAYTFAMTQNNLFKLNKLMVSFSSIGKADNTYWLGPEMSKHIKYNSRIVNYPIYVTNECIDTLEKEIRCHFK
jgi:hypothetical protein